MKLQAKDIKVGFADLHSALLIVQVNKSELKGLEELDPKKGPVIIDIHRLRKKRSLSANAMCWALCEHIAEAVGASKEEVYKRAVKAVGPFIVTRAHRTDVKRLCDMWHRNGLGWVTSVTSAEGEYTDVVLYIGSSEYDTKQMARLIDWLAEEANELELRCPTKEERDTAIGKWKQDIQT